MKKFVRIHLAVAAGIAVYGLLLAAGMQCPFRAVLRIPCPTCGMTRSAAALLQGNWQAFWQNNPGVVLALPAVFLALHWNSRLFARWNLSAKRLVLLAGCLAVSVVYLLCLIDFFNAQFSASF